MTNKTKKPPYKMIRIRTEEFESKYACLKLLAGKQSIPIADFIGNILDDYIADNGEEVSKVFNQYFKLED